MPRGRQVVVLSDNCCRNLVHFRGRLLSALAGAGYELVALAAFDEQAAEIERRGIKVHAVPIARSGLNPLADARLLLRYVKLLRRIRPAAYCGFTIKPNISGRHGYGHG